LILLLDGTWFSFKNQPWILRLGALKPIRGHHAVFLDPLLLQGPESLQGWMQFIETIPPKVRKRICAVVCDNFRSAKKLARQNHWVFQLCHFHLIRQFQSRRGHWKPGIGRPKIRETIYQLVRQALELPKGQKLHQILSRLNRLQHQAPTRRLPMLIREFLRNIDYYQSYQTYRSLNLPSTTNTIESMNRLIRDLMRRCGNLRTPEALQLWITAFIRIRPKMVCNGKKLSTRVQELSATLRKTAILSACKNNTYS
jgi:transposase-like protein